MSKLNPLAAAIGAAVVSSTLSLSALAASPFQATDLQNGYPLADNHDKDVEGKCGEGICGANMKMEEEQDDAGDNDEQNDEESDEKTDKDKSDSKKEG